MVDQVAAEAVETTPTLDGGTLLTDGPEHKPDEGEGDGKPNEGEGEKTPDTSEADKAEEARRAALTDDERAAEDTAAEEARRAALTDEEREAEDKAKADAEGAPEEYADFTAPEGVELEPEVLGKFKAIAKEDNLSQAKAQRYVDAAAELVAKQGDALADEILTTRQGWIDAAKADKEIGGDKLPETLAVAKRAIDTYGSPALKTLLDETGLGNNPEIIRAFAKAGASLAEDKIVGGHKVPNEPVDLADRLYPKQAK